ncbi:MAG: MFS transporter, partial [Actinomycetota bacterium]|nr:MFS transporter [Actinomycetota bacterium]
MGGRTAVLRAALRNPSARRVLAAFFLFNTQEYGIWVAVVIYAYARGGATTAGLVLLAQLVPAMFFAPLASVLGDRMQRGRALLLGYSTQAMAAAALAAALAWAPPPLAYLAAVISAALVSLTRPVHNAILPELAATPDELTAANAASGAMEAVGNFVGPLVISIVIGPGGVALGVGVMAVLMARA